MAFAKLGDMPAWAQRREPATGKRLSSGSSCGIRDDHDVIERVSRHDFRNCREWWSNGSRGRAPIVRYHENAEDGAKAIAAITPTLDAAKLWHFEKLMQRVSKEMNGQFAAKAALDVALMDWIGKKMNVPLYQLFGLDPGDAPVTMFSIGIHTPEITKQKVREAEAFPVLKIKVGLDTDEERWPLCAA